MPDLFRFFKRDKDDVTRYHDGGDNDDLARHMAALTMQQGPRTPPPNRRRSHNEFVGGFYGEQRLQGRDRVRDKPLPPSPFANPPPIPQWQFTRPVPGPLPMPPAMPMPEPAGRPSPSLTFQYAQNAFSSNPVYTQTLGPPPPDLNTRPNSDPSVPTAPEYSRYQQPPTTPKRNAASPTAPVPATLPKPVKTSSSQLSPGGTPTKPARKRSASTSALPPHPPTPSPSGTYQCSGFTQAGQRCRNMVKASATLTNVLGDDEDEDGAIQVYCRQHKQKVLDKKEFLSPVTGEYIKFEDYIPKYLDPATQAAIRVLMTKMASKADRDGYIYGFEILDEQNPEFVYFKVGRTVKLNKRMDEWGKQCGSKSQHLRGRWPEMPGDDAPDLMGRLKEGRKGKFCFRLERLIHLELADLAQNGQYLLSGFPTVSLDFIDSGTPKTKSKKPCVDCGKVHREIFAFKRAQKGHKFHTLEWERIVKEIIHKWGRFVEEHVVQESKD